MSDILSHVLEVVAVVFVLFVVVMAFIDWRNRR